MARNLKLLLGALAVLLVGAGTVFAESIVIKGSTTVLPVAQAALEAYMKANPGVNISLSGGGSGEGIKALIDKSANIANSSREIKGNEVELAKSKGVNPVETIVAVDAIVPIVNPRNKVANLTIDQLSQIYQGKITNWKEVGGDNLQIVVVSRDSSSGTFEAWSEMVLHKAKVAPRAQMQASNGAIVQAVSKNRYAIGYIGLGYVNKAVKPLTVNGVQATARTAISKEFPIARPLYMYTNGQPAGVTAKFIRFILSPAGQDLVAKAGYVPLDGAADRSKKKGK
ncbi:MAG: Phosphate-binding protein PstS 1 precursor [Syntrophaceae bacterium PtaB.Bin095]|jgi:phosphate transport system substrate-binding protein|nr:MAG: Phosphate-binding protein PstS 1 precursor [Syntrophaceae bacterium PtaB.Bin095]